MPKVLSADTIADVASADIRHIEIDLSDGTNLDSTGAVVAAGNPYRVTVAFALRRQGGAFIRNVRVHRFYDQIGAGAQGDVNDLRPRAVTLAQAKVDSLTTLDEAL